MSKHHAIVVVFFLALGALIANGPGPTAQAEGDGEEDEGEPVTEAAEENPTIVPGEPPHDPFTPHPADEGAWTWDDLTPEEQAEVDAMADWADGQNGAPVHNAFSAAVATTSEMRELEEARRASGLAGIETLGVVP